MTIDIIIDVVSIYNIIKRKINHRNFGKKMIENRKEAGVLIRNSVE